MPEKIDRDKLQDLIRAGAQVIDVLPAEEFEQQHIPGATNIPLKQLDRQAAERLDKQRPVISYCYDYQ